MPGGAGPTPCRPEPFVFRRMIAPAMSSRALSKDHILIDTVIVNVVRGIEKLLPVEMTAPSLRRCLKLAVFALNVRVNLPRFPCHGHSDLLDSFSLLIVEENEIHHTRRDTAPEQQR